MKGFGKIGTTENEKSPEGFFAANREVALAFSGGVDSSYLLYLAAHHADRATAYYVKSQFQPEFELKDALDIAEYFGAEIKVLDVDILSFDEVTANPSDRCYYCKRRIMSAIAEASSADGYKLIIDGTNASDDVDDRPGFRVLTEMGIRSPLKEWGLEKKRVRVLAKEAGLKVWDKPAYACLATRIPAGVRISGELLKKTEEAEEVMHAMGFRDFRVRYRDGGALLQVKADQYAKAIDAREEIEAKLGKLYSEVKIDTVMR